MAMPTATSSAMSDTKRDLLARGGGSIRLACVSNSG